jgi:hypothetical protein
MYHWPTYSNMHPKFQTKYFPKFIVEFTKSSLTKLLSGGDGPAVKPLNSIVGLIIIVGIEYPSAVVVVSGGYVGFTFTAKQFMKNLLSI